MNFRRVFITPIVFVLTLLSVKLSAQGLDLRILESINPRYPTSQYWKATSLSAYVAPTVLVGGSLIYGLTSGDEHAKYQSYEIVTGFVLSSVVMEGLKKAVNRTRPGDAHPDLVFPSAPVHGQSFPSGHTSLAFSTAAELSIQYKKWYITVPAYLWAGSVGYSRMYLGKHYPSDVIGGAVVGVGSVYLNSWLNKKFFFKSYYDKKTHSN